MNLTYHRNLDGVRAIAALMVMFFHFFSRIKTDNSFWSGLSKLSVAGQSGVTLFFVLSGFLITRILISSKNETNYFSTFYIRRALRIFPLYYFFLLIYFFLYPLIFQTPKANWHEQLTYFGYLQNIAQTFHYKINGPNHYWSLAVEEHFYLIWPMVIYFSGDKARVRIIFLILSFSFLLRIIMSSMHANVFYFTATRMDALAIGAFLACLECQPTGFASNKKALVIFGCISAIIAISIMLFLNKPIYSFIDSLKYLCSAVFFFSVIYSLLFFKTPRLIDQSLSSIFLQFTGKISYGLYVFHPFAFKLINKFFEDSDLTIRFFLSFGFAYLFAFISFELFEKQFLKLKDRFSHSRTKTSQIT